MIQREYLTEYDEYTNAIRHSITISTDKYHVFKTIKAYVEEAALPYEKYCRNCGAKMNGGKK